MIHYGSSSPWIEKSFLGIVEELSQLVNYVLGCRALVGRLHANQTLDGHSKANQQPVQRNEAQLQVLVTTKNFLLNSSKHSKETLKRTNPKKQTFRDSFVNLLRFVEDPLVTGTTVWYAKIAKGNIFSFQTSPLQLFRYQLSPWVLYAG